MVASREMEHRFLLGTNNNSDRRENQATGHRTFTGATVATLLEKKNDHVVSTMCCCLALGVVNHSVLLLLLLLPGYPEFFLHVRLETSALTHVGCSSINNEQRWPTSQVMVLLVQ